uniref:Uncharacterized protein n=1 Tax=Xiphophorus maculatus TaxID=8083 RepID=A0A3B5RER0_XIPMA
MGDNALAGHIIETTTVCQMEWPAVSPYNSAPKTLNDLRAVLQEEWDATMRRRLINAFLSAAPVLCFTTFEIIFMLC